MLTGWPLLIVFGCLILLVVAAVVRMTVGSLQWTLRYLPMRSKPDYGVCQRTALYPLAESQAISTISRFFAPNAHIVSNAAPYVLHHFWWKVDEQQTTERSVTVVLDYVEDIDRYAGQSAYEFHQSMGLSGRSGTPAISVQTPREFLQQFRIIMEIAFRRTPAQTESAAIPIDAQQSELEPQIADSSPATLVSYDWKIENKINHKSPLALQIIDYTIQQLEAALPATSL